MSVPPELPDYWPAEDNEYWSHHFLVNGAVRNTAPRVRAKYLQSRFAPPREPRPWALEMSGRSLCSATDIEEVALAHAHKVKDTPGLTLRGFLTALAHVIRETHGFEAYIDPTDDDTYHMNVVLIDAPEITVENGADPKPSIEPFERLAKKLNVFELSRLREMLGLCEAT